MRTLTDRTTKDGLTVVSSWGCSCWYCHPSLHPKPSEALRREEAARAARPPMPEEVKELLRERARAKSADAPKRGPAPDEDTKLSRYGPLVAVFKIVGRTSGGCPQVVLACGHTKTVHHDRVEEARCVRCRPGREN